MYRRFLAAGAILCALAVSACTVTSGQVAAIVGGAQAIGTATGQADLVAKAQARVVAVCGFLPTAQTVAAVAKTFSPDTVATIELADRVASGICAAVANPNVAYASGRSRPRPGTYRGVKPRGQFVDRA